MKGFRLETVVRKLNTEMSLQAASVTSVCHRKSQKIKGQYPLHTACAKGDVKLARYLVSQGHFVNDTNFDLVQPLHEACLSGSEECVRFLLEAGAQVNGRNIDGATPLCDACSGGNVECVRLLLENGANVNPQLLLSSPLHEAVLRDNWRCAELLVEYGASLNPTDCHFGTPLHAAVYKGSINCVKVLLKAGCDANSTKILSTPLHMAAREQAFGIVSLLLEFGANPHMKDNNDLSPREVVPTATSPVKHLLHFWESQPRSLKFICRQSIRGNLGQGRLKQIDKLYLPPLLVDFVAYTYI